MPAIFPILLNNGDRSGTAPCNIRALIDSGSIDHIYIPDFSYYIIAENEFDIQTLKRIHNGVAGVFLIENSDPKERRKCFDSLVETIANEQPEIIQLLQSWFLNFLKMNDDKDTLTEKFLRLTEVTGMFATKLEALGKELKAEKKE